MAHSDQSPQPFHGRLGFGELRGSFAILDNVGGSEIILVNCDALTRTRKILALRWSKAYPAHEIRDLRFQRGSGRLPSRIAFEYGASAT